MTIPSEPQKTAGETAVGLVPQPHGGALLCSGVPGNRGGAGRMPSVLRERLRGSLRKRIGVLEQIADDPNVGPADRIKAIEVLCRYGLGQMNEAKIEATSLVLTGQDLGRQLAQALAEPAVRAFLDQDPAFASRLRQELAELSIGRLVENWTLTRLPDSSPTGTACP